MARPIQDASEPRKRAFPAPLTILLGVLVLVWVAAFLIPSGQYQLDETGSPIAGSFQRIDAPMSFGERVGDLLMAPINGPYGIQEPETGRVGPFNSGRLFGSVQVFLFILAIGGFMTVVFATGALDRGIHHLPYRYRAQGPLLIMMLSLLFGILVSVMAWSDETLGFSALMVSLMIALGYDRMVAVAVVAVAPFVGVIGSTINPFVIGVGSAETGVSIDDGIGLRILLFVLCMGAMIAYTLWYAARVKADPSKSLVGLSAADSRLVEADAAAPLPLTRRDKRIIGLVVFTFVLLTFSIMPWGAIFGNYEVDYYTHKTISTPYYWELGWWLPGLTALFLVMPIMVGTVGGLVEQETTNRNAGS